MIVGASHAHDDSQPESHSRYTQHALVIALGY
jgi:hypothetical protein